MTCPAEILELLGAYALDAVEPDEAVLVEDHLRDCPRCRDEVAQHREVAAQMAFAGSNAPAGLWDRIAASLEPGEPEPDLARLYPLRRAVAAHRPWTGRALVAAAAVIVVLAGALGWSLRGSGSGGGGGGVAVASGAIVRAAQEALLDPASTRFNLTSPGGQTWVEAVVEPSGAGFLVPGSAGGLPALPAGETYQLWEVSGPSPVSLGVLGAKPGVVAFQAAGSRALAITREKSGGAAQPTSTPVVVGVA